MSNDSNPAIEPVENTPAEQEAAPSTQEANQDEKRSPKRDENFRLMEKRVRDAEAKIRELEAEKQRYQPPEPNDLDDTDLVTAAHLKRMLQDALQKKDLETLEDRLMAKHSDFNNVVTEDAVEELRVSHPEIFNTLKANPDPYTKGLAAYKFIKTLKQPSKEDAIAKENSKKLDENRSKPNVSAANTSVLSQATGWVKPSKEMKAALLKEMKEARSKR